MTEERPGFNPSPIVVRTVAVLTAAAAVALCVYGAVYPRRTPTGDFDWRINVNEAQTHELAAIPGIGPALADRIVAHRLEHGEFASLDDLEDVPGIGPATIELLKPWIVAE